MATFITGACGFVGLALAERLLQQGETVVGFDQAPLPAAAARAFAALPGRLAMVQGDVRNGAALEAAMRTHRPQRLVTLAAITADVRRERAAPASIFEVNLGGVVAALSAAAACGVQRVLHASSGSVYGASGKGAAALQEDRTPLQPEGLYGISKQAAEAAALRLAALHGLDLVVGRLGTCFGPWEADTGVRDTLSAPLQVLLRAERGEAVRLPRDSHRDWLYVRDAAAGLQALLDTPRLPHAVYNVAAGFMGTMAEWCEVVATQHPGWSWRISAAADSNIDYYAPYDRAPMDITRLRADTGFVPRYDLHAAAEDFFAWRRAHSAATPLPAHA
ncbi:NAD-dependent epimerase/dehydratase family protein [Pseudorhodoferax soli]|uniref:UDP-glucuronate 4-epimerase n=1 Tax=Pseudorhodoferax soli TaxID=545864 RepID=A0A368YAA7_9BURK|nr:NAD(P)-dependent oxidoreductase [Pseudorhodoferax soli]RCW76368.1 UDP-glucuronate 4-epimerase [Pseudorhodoferax soli]